MHARNGQVSLGGHPLAYEFVGDGEPLLLLTNIGIEAGSMRPLAPLLPDHQLVLVDHQAPLDVTIEAAAERIGLLLDHLDLAPWVWGHSQGAYLAQELALARPDRVRAAVMVATLGRQTGFYATYLAASRAILDAAVPDELAGCLALLATTPIEVLLDDDHTAFLQQQALEIRHGVHARREERSLRASGAYDDRLGALAKVQVPCLVVAFERDLVCAPRLGQEVAAAIPGCAYLEIPGAAHNGLSTHTLDVLDAVTAFFRQQAEQGC